MRLIDADKLLEGIAELKQSPWFNSKYGYADRKEAVEAIEYLCIKKEPTVNAESMWIPCSERLPEVDGLYLATFTLIGIPKFSNVESFKNGKWEYHDGYIIAWQPLPKPWKGADDE